MKLSIHEKTESTECSADLEFDSEKERDVYFVIQTFRKLYPNSEILTESNPEIFGKSDSNNVEIIEKGKFHDKNQKQYFKCTCGCKFSLPLRECRMINIGYHDGICKYEKPQLLIQCNCPECNTLFSFECL